MAKLTNVRGLLQDFAPMTYLTPLEATEYLRMLDRDRKPRAAQIKSAADRYDLPIIRLGNHPLFCCEDLDDYLDISARDRIFVHALRAGVACPGAMPAS
jgi:hypothetical protein